MRERSLLFWLALVAGAALLIAGPLRDGRPIPALLAFGLAVTGPLAASYRPLGSSLVGLGGVVVPVSAWWLGPAVAGLLASVAALGGWGLRRRLTTLEEDPPPERRGAPRVASAGVRAGCAGLVAAHLLVRFGSDPDLGGGPGTVAGVAAAAAFLGMLAVTDAAERWLRARPMEVGPRSRLAAERALGALAWDGLGLVLGIPFVWVVAGAGWGPAFALLSAIAALSLAAAHGRISAGELRRRVAGLESVGGLAGRVGPGGRRQADMASTILAELRKTVRFSFVQLDVVDPEGALQSWWASENSEIRRGHAEPGEHPPPLPGIHRRRRWVRLDRDLVAAERKLGRFRIWCDPGRQPKPDLEVLDHLVPQLASLIERSALDREARYDSLTGTTRRQVFDEALRRAFDEARSRGAAVAVVLCDIDHFKRVNDSRGHAAGDVVLREIGALLRQDHRDSDVVCRYGGEEFAILLPDTDGAHALRTAERIRRQVEEAPIEHEGVSIPVTLSAGVASFPELYVESSPELLELADRALYTAKENGRNRALAAVGGDAFLTPAGVRLGAEPQSLEPPQL